MNTVLCTQIYIVFGCAFFKMQETMKKKSANCLFQEILPFNLFKISWSIYLYLISIVF